MSTHMWNTAVAVVNDALQDVDPVKVVASLAVGYAAFKLFHMAVMAPTIPSIWVPLKPGE